jgi:hypothetical protein
MSSLQVDLPAFATQEDVDAPVPIANARLANLLDAGFNAGLLATTGFVMVGRTIEFEDAARPPDRHAPFDYKGAALMLSAMPKAKQLLADKGYDADWFRTAQRGFSGFIPSKSNRRS